MTDYVDASFNSTIRSRTVNAGRRYGAVDWVVQGERLVEDPEGNLATGALNAFGETSTASSLSVTIDTGEALVDGAYIARDTTTSVTLAASTAGQTVYVGWDDSVEDTVIIGLDADFTAPDGQVALFDFDTDGSGVTSVTDRRELNDLDAQLANAGGSVKYNQSTPPTSPSAGETWYDNSSGIFRVYADLGSGLAWHPIPPVQVLEEASTFAESDVTVTHTDTAVSSGSITLQSGASVSREADDSTGSSDRGQGIVINPNENLSGITATISSNTGSVQDVFITDTSENILDEVTAGYSAGDTVTLSASLSSGTKYYVGVYDDGTTYDEGQNTNPSFPYTSTAIDIVAGVVNAHPDDGFAASEDTFEANTIISVGTVGPTSGDALVEWDTGVPADIKSYDLATFQRTLAGETVTIDVEDGAGNVLFSDIGQNFDISTVDTSKEVKLRANLSRTDTANNPTCDYLARRFVR